MKTLMVHGVNTNEEANPNPYDAWCGAIKTGLHGASYHGGIQADSTVNGVNYNDIFDKHDDNPVLYGAAVAKLMATLVWHPRAVTPLADQALMAAVPGQPSDGFLSAIRWTAGMVAQWLVEPDLRSDCRDRLVQHIQSINPDVIFAHSLGTLLCYDLFVNDPRGKTLFAKGTLVTFGSQIGNTAIRDDMWGGRVKAIKVKMWYNLYNPNDPVFVAPIAVAAANYHEFAVNPPFGGQWLDLSGHEVTQGDGHPGYLDNTTTNANLWPALAGGSMASLIARNIRIMKRTPKNSPVG